MRVLSTCWSPVGAQGCQRSNTWMPSGRYQWMKVQHHSVSHIWIPLSFGAYKIQHSWKFVSSSFLCSRELVCQATAWNLNLKHNFSFFLPVYSSFSQSTHINQHWHISTTTGQIAKLHTDIQGPQRMVPLTLTFQCMADILISYLLNWQIPTEVVLITCLT